MGICFHHFLKLKCSNLTENDNNNFKSAIIIIKIVCTLFQLNDKTPSKVWREWMSTLGWVAEYILTIFLISLLCVKYNYWTSKNLSLTDVPFSIWVTTLLFWVLLYLTLLYEATVADIVTFLKKRKSLEDILLCIQQGRGTMPNVLFRVQCHNYKTPQGKRISFEKYVNIPVLQCVDASGDLDPNLFHGHRKLTRVCITFKQFT